MKRTNKNDRRLLENLINTYGVNRIKNAIKMISEHYNDIDEYERPERRFNDIGMSNDDIEFLKDYSSVVFSWRDQSSDFDYMIEQIWDEDVKNFAKNKKKRIEAKVNEYINHRKQLEQKYGKDTVNKIIRSYDTYSN